VSNHPVLVTATALAEALQGEHPPVVLDVRWTLDGPPGHGVYLTGHIPGAVYVDLDTELSGHGEPTDGRHPLPAAADLQTSLSRWGVDDGDAVVVYDGGGNLAAARAWWLLRWAGLLDVRLLDGALPAWTAAGGGLDLDDVVPAPGTAQVRADSLAALTAEQAGGWPEHGVLLDARAAERYRGETEPVDPKAGHIPGAVSAPTVENLAPDGRFRSPAELTERFAAVGVHAGTPVAVYCGSGVTAAHELAALAVAGIDATLYPGSWSQWSNLDLPVETSAPAAQGGSAGDAHTSDE
jgi:thiosulfate/3-mercaptopyruvate sulfurtransferase